MPVIAVRLPDELIEKIDHEARKWSKSRAAEVRELLAFVYATVELPKPEPQRRPPWLNSQE